MKNGQPICLALQGKKVVIRTVSFGTASGLGEKYTGVVVGHFANAPSGDFLMLDTGAILNIKYVVSIDIID